MGVNSKDKRDFYYFKAKKLNYRARSAFKLIDINDSYEIFKNVNDVLDLCAAPGSWSQVLSKEINGNIIAVDIQEMIPIENVKILKEDITSQQCIDSILSISINGVDLVVCDGAPDVTGFHDLDQFLQMDLLKASLKISTKILKIGGSFVAKCFRGEYTKFIVHHFKKYFKNVIITKPKSSRGNSIECFIVCKEYNGNRKVEEIEYLEDLEEIECFECGNGISSDFTIEYVENINNIEKPMPVNPPYKEAILKRRNQLQ